MKATEIQAQMFSDPYSKSCGSPQEPYSQSGCSLTTLALEGWLDIWFLFSADREVQRILLELLNQMDGFDQTVNVKVCVIIVISSFQFYTVHLEKL